MRTLLGYVWTMPVTVPGVCLAAMALRGGRLTVRDGVVEAYGPALRWCLARVPIPGGAAAITLGHVVLARDADTIVRSRAHERVHVAQYERWGCLFLPLYLGSSVWAWMRGRHPYFDNRFEREAHRRARLARTGDGAISDGARSRRA